MNWSMQTRPAMGRALPATHTGARPLPLRGTPSAYPRGTTASVVSRGVVYVWPYDTPCPAGTRLTSITVAHTVMAGRSPKSTPGTGVSPYTAMPGRTRSKWASRRVSVAGA